MHGPLYVLPPGAAYPELSGYYPQPKGLLFPAFLSVQSLSGSNSPFTIEANYNSAMVSYNLPFTICHDICVDLWKEEAKFIGLSRLCKCRRYRLQLQRLSSWLDLRNQRTLRSRLRHLLRKSTTGFLTM